MGLLTLIMFFLSGAQVIAAIPDGLQPLPDVSRGCLPADERRFFSSDLTAAAAAAAALEGHGVVCLDELRFDRALSELRTAARLEPTPCTFIELGVAYDGLSRRSEAAASWRHAAVAYRRKPVYGPPRFTLGLESPLLHGDVARAMRILKREIEPKFEPNGTWQAYSGPDKNLAEAFGAAIERAVAGHPKQGAAMITALYRRGLQDNGAVRYARGVMLLAVNHESQEAQTELRLAAYHQLAVAGEDCSPTVYEWSAVYLLEHV